VLIHATTHSRDDIFCFNIISDDFYIHIGLVCGFIVGISNGFLNLRKVFFKYDNQIIRWRFEADKDVQEAKIDNVSSIKEDWKSVYFNNNETTYEIVTSSLSNRQKKMIVKLLEDFASHNPK